MRKALRLWIVIIYLAKGNFISREGDIMPTPLIFHVDVNSAFLSWEEFGLHILQSP